MSAEPIRPAARLQAAPAEPIAQAHPAERAPLASLVRYFLGLGTWGFGGPVALVGSMHRNLVERRRWVSDETYEPALALAQIMPGPLAAQCTIALGYFEYGLVRATLVGLSFTRRRS